MGQSDLQELVRILREKQTALSSEDLDTIVSAAGALDVELVARPEWKALPGRGLFFVFEGLDRIGKSTQSKRLAKHLEETGNVKWMCFPDRSTLWRVDRPVPEETDRID